MRGTTSNIVYKMYNIPIKIANLQKADTTGLKQGSPCCNDLVGRKNVCKGCEKELESSELLKIYPLGDDNHVFSKEQIDALKDFDDIIEVIGSIPKSEIDFRKICGAFVVLPDKKQKKKSVKMFEKAYKVFENSIAQSDKAIVVKFSTRQKQKLGIMTSIDGRLILLHIVYDELFNEIDEERPQVEVSDAELKQGLDFIEKLDSVDVTEIEDNFKVKLEALIENGTPLTVTVPESDEKEEMGFFTQ